MNNRFAIILIAIILGFFGILFFTKNDKNKTANSTQAGQTSNHTYGEGKSGVVLVEYGDFECTGCLSYYPIVKQVKEKYKDQITFQFKHYPLVEAHQHALIGARAAEAAGIQNKFWEMHDLLFENQRDQDAWAESTDPLKYFEKYAQELSLDVEKFKTDLASEEVNRIVQADRSEAKEKGYNSTPTFELDGKKLEDIEPTLDYFSKVLDEAIKQKSGQ